MLLPARPGTACRAESLGRAQVDRGPGQAVAPHVREVGVFRGCHGLAGVRPSESSPPFARQTVLLPAKDARPAGQKHGPRAKGYRGSSSAFRRAEGCGLDRATRRAVCFPIRAALSRANHNLATNEARTFEVSDEGNTRTDSETAGPIAYGQRMSDSKTAEEAQVQGAFLQPMFPVRATARLHPFLRRLPRLPARTRAPRPSARRDQVQLVTPEEHTLCTATPSPTC